MKKKILQFVLAVFLLIVYNTRAQTVINTLEELKAELNTSDESFVMTPGTYYFNTDNCGPGKLFSDPRLLLFTGNNSVFDFTDVKFEIDTNVFTQFGSIDVIEFWPVGSNNIYKNLTLEDIGNTVPTKGAGTLHLDGSDNLVEGFKTTTRGSFPYGYGDIFGKGGGSVVSHNKHSGILIRGDRNHIKNCTVIMRAYGHGIFVQGSHDAVIEGCYVEGELRTIGEVLQEEGTGSPADNVDFLTVWGFDLRDHQSDYTFSLQEAGIRAYSTGVVFDSDGNSTGVSRGTLNTTVLNCTIVKMRVGVNTGAEGGENKRIENCTALACEGGFWLGNDGDVINCRADASVGPILSEDIARSNATYEVTLLDDYIPKIGNAPYFYMGGTNHNITIHDGTTYYNPDIKIVLGGTRLASRFLVGSVEPPPTRNANNVTLINNTPYPVVLENAFNCDVFSCGPVTNNGSDNTVTQLDDCSEKLCNNTANNLEAECYDDMLGVGVRGIPENNNQKEIYGIRNEDWINFNAIDLTGMTSITAVVSSMVNDAAIEVRMGGVNGALLATVAISSTLSEETYHEFSVGLNQVVSGLTDLYFVFRHGTETGWLFNLDKISFEKDPCSSASYNPLLPISAEAFCSSSDITLQNRSAFNQVVTTIENTDYLKFANVDFGNDDVFNAIQILASSATDGGQIEVRSGAVDGVLLTTVNVESTGDWNDYKMFSSYSNTEITGLHDIYLVFTGGNGNLLNIDNFYFYNDTCLGGAYEAYSQISALEYCQMFGVVPINDAYLGGINDKDWIRYGSVDFTTLSPPQITFNVAGYPTEATVENGYINVMLDHPKEGAMIATATVPKTGGWEVWEEITVPLLQEVTGEHEVYLHFGNGAFNLDWFEFHDEVVSLDNLALATNGSVATQSSTAYEGVAGRAIDGNTNGNYGDGSVTHTEHGATGFNVLKWWQVDLGADKAIRKIAVYGRTGSNYVNDLNSFTVEVKNANGDVVFTQFFENYPSSRPLTIDTGTIVGQVVRISKASDRGLSLAEVEVLGTSSLSVDDVSLEKIGIYPNPAENRVTIRNGSGLKLEIYDILGALESEFIILENEKVLSLEMLPLGIYFFKFKSEKGITVKKVIKK
ncbi:carbohydrate-binding protein [Mariniflexile ostreae]|uniref:Carbohydrate-binding protein n=1 Tax=Mariniflexile ostreae TaxID=1520892 RepID=A0ABV5FA43_9FLAO